MLVDKSFDAVFEDKNFSSEKEELNSSKEDRGTINLNFQNGSEVFFAEDDIRQVNCSFDNIALDLLIPSCKRNYSNDFEN